MKLLTILLAVLLTQTFSVRPAFAIIVDSKDRGGGDEVGLDFLASTQRILEKKSSHEKIASLLKKIPLQDLMEKTKVLVTDLDLVVAMDGVLQKSIAINDPSTFTIQINRKRWNNLKDDSIKEAIALHELLSLIRIESTGDYPISGMYLTLENKRKQNLQNEYGEPNRNNEDFFSQLRVVCRADSRTSNFFVSILLNQGFPAQVQIYSSIASYELVATFLGDSVSLSHGEYLLNASGLSGDSFFQLDSSYSQYGGDISNPEEAYWKGKISFSPSLAKKLGVSSAPVACEHEI